MSPDDLPLQEGAHGAGNSGAVTLEPAPGEAQHLEAEELQTGVPGTILLEGGARAVRFPAVELDDEALGAPEKVHDETVEVNVDFGLRKAVPSTEAEEPRLAAFWTASSPGSRPDGSHLLGKG
jgi:hypothetical protein